MSVDAWPVLGPDERGRRRVETRQGVEPEHEESLLCWCGPTIGLGGLRHREFLWLPLPDRPRPGALAPEVVFTTTGGAEVSARLVSPTERALVSAGMVAWRLPHAREVALALLAACEAGEALERRARDVAER